MDDSKKSSGSKLSGARTIVDELMTFTVNEMAKMFIEEGYEKEDVQKVADKMNAVHKTGKIVVRRKPEPKAKAAKDDADKSKKKGRATADLRSAIMGDETKFDVQDFEGTPIAETVPQGERIPKSLKGSKIYDDEAFGLGKDECVIGFPMKGGGIHAYRIADDRMKIRKLTSEEALELKTCGFTVADDDVDDDDQDYYEAK